MLFSASVTTILSLSSFIGLSSAGYTLKDDYSGSGFFSKFDFFTDNDPTSGYVDYVSQSNAQGANLINTNNGKAYMGVDSSNVASGRGRQSVRLTSKATYNHALIVLDLDHMPGSTCGTWPAFWTVGSNWPANGEIDIIEGVNSQTSNDMTLHTSGGCSVSSSSSKKRDSAFTGKLGTSNCDVNAPGQSNNAGCQISASSGNSYGDGFNKAGGGIYATEWTSDFIRIWFFSHDSAPSDVSSDSPDPSKWGTPTAYFGSSGCDIDSHFQNHNIVFDTTFCGQWAGSVWGSDATCSAKAGTCEDFVKNNPNAFKESYWSVNSLRVYQSGSSKRSETTETFTNSTSSSTAVATWPRVSSQTISSASTVTTMVAAPVNRTSTPTSNPTAFTAFVNATSSRWTASTTLSSFSTLISSQTTVPATLKASTDSTSSQVRATTMLQAYMNSTSTSFATPSAFMTRTTTSLRQSQAPYSTNTTNQSQSSTTWSTSTTASVTMASHLPRYRRTTY